MLPYIKGYQWRVGLSEPLEESGAVNYLASSGTDQQLVRRQRRQLSFADHVKGGMGTVAGQRCVKRDDVASKRFVQIHKSVGFVLLLFRPGRVTELYLEAEPNKFVSEFTTNIPDTNNTYGQP